MGAAGITTNPSDGVTTAAADSRTSGNIFPRVIAAGRLSAEKSMKNTRKAVCTERLVVFLLVVCFCDGCFTLREAFGVARQGTPLNLPRNGSVVEREKGRVCWRR